MHFPSAPGVHHDRQGGRFEGIGVLSFASRGNQTIGPAVAAALILAQHAPLGHADNNGSDRRSNRRLHTRSDVRCAGGPVAML
eukprot:CAMPEP_0113554984 /NCGR_PEP_ID=MMETSP0015_2-20120614/16459_1 /TAXON_ID=2838 /ORGANISM="Odontella" /LENGTH=82 /DNA_ID=CAMNT_0000456199 /DNA_START=457 /DNA_END=702 /DNA_ORIENTATION=- /assembly_acc=CAM_ASM_000160